VAILAMLAFFVLPPFLQMGASVGGTDPTVASWTGGQVRESDMMRAVAMRTVLNQFLLDAVAASGRDPGRMQLLPDDEEDVVRTMLLAREAEANGVTVSNAAINEFLGEWTNNMVRPEQFEALIARRRMGPMAVSQADVFEALRTVLTANRMERMFLAGFAGDPPGLRWNYFRRLEQGATVEVVPVVVEKLAGAVPAPAESSLQSFYERYKNDLPAARSSTPGFKEPRRVSYEYLVARRESFEAQALADVTDEQVKKFYEENKERLYRVKAAEPESGKPGEAAAAAAKPEADKSAPAKAEPEKKDAESQNQAGDKDKTDATSEPADKKSEPEKKPDVGGKDGASGSGDAAPKPASEPAPAAAPAAGEPKPAAGPEPKAAVPPRRRILATAFRQPKPDDAAKQAADVAAATAEKTQAVDKASEKVVDEKAPAKEPAAQPEVKPEPKPAAATDAVKDAPAKESPAAADEKPKADVKIGEKAEEKAGEKAAPADAAAAFEPLAKVADDIRRRLAADAASRRIDAVFAAVAGDVARYAEDLALWQAQVGASAQKPLPPDIDAIAKKQGLEAGRGQRLSGSEAEASGGVAATFEIVADPNSRMGFRQVTWLEQIFGRDVPMLRPAGTRDVAGDRYLSWKTEDQPEFVPSFAVARAGVEQAWRIVEGRPLARKVAEEIVAKAASGSTLAAVVAERKEPKLEAATVGPFSWLSRGSAQFGSAPSLSQPDGLSMPGVDFMEAVFALPPGGTTVVFNEPQTVCYAVRLVSYEPDDAKLREQFIDSRTDQRRLMMVAQQEEAKAVDGWIKAVEKRYALEWKRPPRSAR
jgi:hypothetical protein